MNKLECRRDAGGKEGMMGERRDDGREKGWWGKEGRTGGG